MGAPESLPAAGQTRRQGDRPAGFASAGYTANAGRLVSALWQEPQAFSGSSDAYGFRRKARARLGSPSLETSACLRGDARLFDAADTKAQVDAEFAVHGLHRPQRQRAVSFGHPGAETCRDRSASLAPTQDASASLAPSRDPSQTPAISYAARDAEYGLGRRRRRSQSASRAGGEEEQLGYARRDAEYGLGKRGRASTSSPSQRGRGPQLLAHTPEPLSPADGAADGAKSEFAQGNRRRPAPEAEASARMAVIARPPELQETRPARAQVLARERSSRIPFARPPLPREALRPAGTPRAGFPSWRSVTAGDTTGGGASSARFSPREARASNAEHWWPPSPGRSPSPCREDPLQRLCYEGTSEGAWNTIGGAVEEGHRRGHVRDAFQDGDLPSCVGRGRRKFHVETALYGKSVSPRGQTPASTYRTVVGSGGVDYEAAGPRIEEVDPFYLTDPTVVIGRTRGRRHQGRVGEHHFVSTGVAAGSWRRCGNAAGEVLEGGLPRAIGRGRRPSPQKYLDHFAGHDQVTTHLVLPNALDALAPESAWPRGVGGFCRHASAPELTLLANLSHGSPRPGFDYMVSGPVPPPLPLRSALGGGRRLDSPDAIARADEPAGGGIVARDESPRTAALHRSNMRYGLEQAAAESASKVVELRRLRNPGVMSPTSSHRQVADLLQPALALARGSGDDGYVSTPFRLVCLNNSPSALWMRWKGSGDWAAEPLPPTRTQAVVGPKALDAVEQAAGVCLKAVRPTYFRFEGSVPAAKSESGFTWCVDEVMPSPRAVDA